MLVVIVFGQVLYAQSTCNADPMPTNSCTVSIASYCAGDTYQLPPGAHCYCDGVPRVCSPCWINKCARNTADETCPKCAAAAAAAAAAANPVAGAPISLSNGNTFIEQMDIHVPGLGGGLTLTRTWNSKWPASQTGSRVGIFGPNWRSTYEERVFLGSDTTLKYSRSEGSFWSYGFDSYLTGSQGIIGSTFKTVAPGNVTTSLKTGASSWTIEFQNGEKRIFDSTTGNLTAIIDRNGNTTQLSYDASARLVKVTDPAGRYLNFVYGGSSSYLVTSVTSNVGLSLAYTYDSQGRLIQVTKPDQTTVSFDYDSQSFITAVRDSEGKILESHTYDSQGRGLSSSRAQGIDALTVTYP